MVLLKFVLTSDSIAAEDNPTVVSSQDEEILSISEELQRQSPSKALNSCGRDRISGYFCSDTVFNLSKKVLTDIEIKVLEKGLDYAAIQNKINEPELRKDFEGFCRRMRLKWNFRKEPTPSFSEKPVFAPKLTWKAPKVDPNLEVFLSQVERELFEIANTSLGYSNFSKEEWQAMRELANDRIIVIKQADKGSCVVVLDRSDYIAGAEKQLSDQNVYRDVDFKDKILQDLADSSNKLFQNLKRKGSITGKELKYFTIDFKKATNLGKFYLLPKIHKRLENVPGRPVISNCGTSTEKVSELKPVMQSSWPYIKDSGDFIKKIKDINNSPKDSILVTADVVELYPSIPHRAGLEPLEKALNNRTDKKVSTGDLVKMAKFILKNNYFEFYGKVKQQILGTAKGTMFAPPYVCMFMDEVETSFLDTQELKPLVWFRYIDDVFSIWNHRI